MSLTSGRGPLTARPYGRFSRPVPEGLAYLEPCRRRIRARVGDRMVIDTESAILVHRPGCPPAYAFPLADVGDLPRRAEPDAEGFVQVPWDAVDAWFEEEEEVFLHPRNPYHRIEILRSNRRLRVEVGGSVLVDTTDTVVLYETALEPRLYVAREHVFMDRLVASPTTSLCPSKGRASYFSASIAGQVVEDVAWSYEDPLPESSLIGGLLAFDPERAVVAQEIPEAR